jgi:hypothetical protein
MDGCGPSKRALPGSRHCVFRGLFFFTFFRHITRYFCPEARDVHTQRDTYVPWNGDSSRARPKTRRFAAFALHWGGVWLAYLCSPQWHALVFRPYIFLAHLNWPHGITGKFMSTKLWYGLQSIWIYSRKKIGKMSVLVQKIGTVCVLRDSELAVTLLPLSLSKSSARARITTTR